MAIDPRELRRCLGHFTTGVTVITCQGADGAPHGATVNAFTAVSLEPPLVLVSLDRRSRLCSLVEARPFTVNVLESRQKDLALHFAGRPNQDVEWLPDSACGAPRLGGALAHVSCTPWQSYDGGDHVLYLGEVQEFLMNGGEPLLFHTGKFHHLGDDHEPLLWGDSADGPQSQSWIPPHAAAR
ncbi:Nitrilotriacetate monooxygenase component B [Pseudonocardia sp. Ae168_Ps1]|uniref:flavin reductase family protein n=1 Tax=unclassified Pseudonocardia TaxID=2619320 RepID=UPI0001FFDB67|nr:MULTISPECIES: flavin reductase family protein [unclassified Pseudonocardia]ALE75377.1 oxidoreductase [Pseudonocardia sp. EC080625-04]ALL74739.1 oxidoreductase [Pseudonocardia sp. EC080610-09]ALL81762.1 oxidoreductase [Pseudonocardia sp. EC080619-01]OLL76489.1 Nitrilotriacetate monooxygenase component B [Pseudonocardia sp. Ae150A_Ps1]OLL82499.1 Nitrilotriacetate monooxygenase component B [Pseudonocardia sp. Ae168_Ps1]